MEEHQLWITAIVNRVMGKPVAALLALLHIHPENAAAPIPNHIAMELLVFAVAILFFTWLRRQLTVERPGAVQQCMEMLITNPLGLGVRDMLEGFVGHGSQQYVAMLGSIGIFVLFCNLISLIPSLESPTGTTSVPLGCAVVVFLYYHWCGLRKHGATGYAKQFLGPVLLVAPLMALVEVFSHLARLLSLTVRLWVNMMVSELLYVTFLGLTLALFLFTGGLNPIGYSLGVLPLIGPPAFIVLHIFVGFVQAFVFTILPIIYVGGAVAEHH
jgi:F-type H+-transporting ATPase subunit a